MSLESIGLVPKPKKPAVSKPPKERAAPLENANRRRPFDLATVSTDWALGIAFVAKVRVNIDSILRLPFRRKRCTLSVLGNTLNSWRSTLTNFCIIDSKKTIEKEQLLEQTNDSTVEATLVDLAAHLHLLFTTAPDTVEIIKILLVLLDLLEIVNYTTSVLPSVWLNQIKPKTADQPNSLFFWSTPLVSALEDLCIRKYYDGYFA